MNDADPAARGLVISYRCSGCSRSFVELDDVEPAGSHELVCTCGASLVPHPVTPGLYELGASAAPPKSTTRPAQGSIPKEPDRGYGASHGYDVTHGGPSGPGDAPADVPDHTT